MTASFGPNGKLNVEYNKDLLPIRVVLWTPQLEFLDISRQVRQVTVEANAGVGFPDVSIRLGGVIASFFYPEAEVEA